MRLCGYLLRFLELHGLTGANEIVHRDVKRVVHHAIELAKGPRITWHIRHFSSDRNPPENKSFLDTVRLGAASPRRCAEIGRPRIVRLFANAGVLARSRG